MNFSWEYELERDLSLACHPRLIELRVGRYYPPRTLRQGSGQLARFKSATPSVGDVYIGTTRRPLSHPSSQQIASATVALRLPFSAMTGSTTSTGMLIVIGSINLKNATF
jgi:hypothetical protein